MGMIQCKKHGFTGFMTGVDTELSKGIQNNLFHDDIMKIKLIYKFDEYPDVEEADKLGEYESFYYIGLDKFHKKALKKEYILCSEDDEEKLRYTLENLHNGGMCGKCFNEYVEKNGIQILK